MESTEEIFDTPESLIKLIEAWEKTKDCPAIDSIGQLEAVVDNFLDADKVQKILSSSEEEVWTFYIKVTKLVIDSTRVYDLTRLAAPQTLIGSVITCIEVIDQTLDLIIVNLTEHRHPTQPTQTASI